MLQAMQRALIGFLPKLWQSVYPPHPMLKIAGPMPKWQLARLLVGWGLWQALAMLDRHLGQNLKLH